jgi:hypothetical protein
MPPHHIPLSKSGEISVGGAMDHIRGVISLIPLKPPMTTSNPNFNHHVLIPIHMDMMKITISTLHLELQ